jgi:hypothetical protein
MKRRRRMYRVRSSITSRRITQPKKSVSKNDKNGNVHGVMDLITPVRKGQRGMIVPAHGTPVRERRCSCRRSQRQSRRIMRKSS